MLLDVMIGGIVVLGCPSSLRLSIYLRVSLGTLTVPVTFDLNKTQCLRLACIFLRSSTIRRYLDIYVVQLVTLILVL